MKSGFALIAPLFLLASPAYALIPAAGVWWNPQASGSGFVIERQGQTMMLGAFTYDSSGAPLWYQAAGVYDDQTNTFTGEGNTFTGGQCLGCDYSSPTAIPSGDFSVSFIDSEHALVSFPGGSYVIEHFNFGFVDKEHSMLGEWVLSLNGLNAEVAPGGPTVWIVFDSVQQGQGDAPTMVLGRGVGDSSEVYASSVYDPASDSYLINVVVPPANPETYPNYGNYYQMKGDDRMMTGSIVSNGPDDPTLVAAFRLTY